MTRPPRDAVRREILHVARHQFATVGFRATSLQAIADEVPCSKATLLYHFQSKPAILDVLVSPLTDDLRDVVERSRALPEPERTTWLLEASVDLVVRHRDALAMLRGLEDGGDLSGAVAEAQTLGEEALSVFLGATPTALERAQAHTFREGVLGACLQMHDVPDAELSGALRDVGRRIFGLAPPPGG